MSDDTIEDVDLARADWSYPIPFDLDDSQRRFENPLVRGLIVLLMVAVATTVLVATDDDDEASIAASGTTESDPAGPEASEVPATSVQAVASEVGSSNDSTDDAPGDGDDSASAWAEDGTSIQESAAAEIRRQQALRDRPTTTTTAPTTTEAPTTTAAPTTESTTETSAADTTADNSSSSTDADADAATSSTDSTADSTPDGQSTTSSTSPETTVPETTVAETTTTAPAETTTTVAAGDGWVDTGNGVLVPPVLLAIRWCESRDDYQAANPSSSARGAYQFLSGSWAAYGHADRYGVSTADQATRVQQDQAALLTWERDGTRPWNASRSCWSQRI